MVDNIACSKRLDVSLTDDEVADRTLRTLQAVDLLLRVRREQSEDAEGRVVRRDSSTVEFDLSGKFLFEDVTIALEEHGANWRVVTDLLGNHAVGRRHELVSLSQHRVERLAHSILEVDRSDGVVYRNLDESLRPVRL